MGYKLNNGGVPIDMIAALINGHNFTTFVETGTSSGQSVLAAAQSGLFNELYTVELNEGTIREDLKPHITDNIHFHIGDSVEFLKSLQIKSPAVYWLDAHYSGSEPAPEGVDECPLLNEISYIFKGKDPNDILLVIDDARLFLGAPPYPHDPMDWPTLCEIFDRINIMCDDDFHHMTVVDDYIISFPQKLKGNYDKFWQETYPSRYL